METLVLVIDVYNALNLVDVIYNVDYAAISEDVRHKLSESVATVKAKTSSIMERFGTQSATPVVNNAQ